MGVAERAFRVLGSGMYRLGGFKLLGTLFAAILVERHGLDPFPPPESWSDPAV